MRIKSKLVSRGRGSRLLLVCAATLVVVGSAAGCTKDVVPEPAASSQPPQAGQPPAQKPQVQTGPVVNIPTPSGNVVRPAAPTVALSPTPARGNPNLPKDAALFADKWRIYSERLYYDAGGGGAVNQGGRNLQVSADGGWEFGNTSGQWSVSAISPEDWTRWGVTSYGPTRKITLSGWNQGTADGPLEESAGRIDFLWVIYQVGPPTVSSPGKIWIKFGHS